MQSDRLLDLTNRLHAGALDDDAWSAALDAVSDVFAGAAVIFGTEGNDAGDRGFVGHRYDPAAVALIGGPLANPQANPFLAAMPLLPTGRSHLTAETCGERALAQSALYREALVPFGARYVLGGMMDRVGGRATIVALVRGARAGNFDRSDQRSLDRLMPNLATALHARRQFAAWRDAARASLERISAMGQGLIVVGRDNRVMIANDEAERILALGDGLGWRRGLWARDKAALARARRAQGEGKRATMAFSRPSALRPFIVTIVPAPADSGAATLIQIADPEREQPVARDLLCAIYGLTAAEAALAAELRLGHELSEAAARLEIRPNTAKTHLKAIFEKVGVHRQSALVRRLLLDLPGV